MTTNQLFIQSSIAGFQGQPISLVGMLDSDSGVLVIAKQIPFSEDKHKPDFAMVSNLDLKDVDYNFSNDDMREAIEQFFNLKAQGLIDIVDSVGRYDPENRVERQGVDQNGPKYGVSPDIDCGQIGVLAMTLYCVKQRGINSAMEAISEMSELFGIQTI